MAFGDPAAADPFDVAPVPCRARAAGVDTGPVGYDFDAISRGVRLRVPGARGLVTLGGQASTGPRDFAFATGGPADPKHDSARGQRVDRRGAGLRARARRRSPRTSSCGATWGSRWRVPQARGFRVLTGVGARRRSRRAPRRANRGPVLVIQAVQRFPNRARVILVWGKGVAAASGAADRTSRCTSKVRRSLTVRVDCRAREECPAASRSRRSASGSRRRSPWAGAAASCSEPAAGGGRRASTRPIRRGRAR